MHQQAGFGRPPPPHVVAFESPVAPPKKLPTWEMSKYRKQPWKRHRVIFQVFFWFQPLAILLVAMFACLLLVFWYSPGRQFFWLGFWLGRCAFRTHPECFSSKRRALQMNPKCTAPKPEAQPKKLPAWDVPKHKQKASKCPNQKNCQSLQNRKKNGKITQRLFQVFLPHFGASGRVPAQGRPVGRP